MKLILCWFILTAFQFHACYGGRILVLLPLGSRSHKLSIMPVIEELAQRGHEITIFSGYESPIEMDNIREIKLISMDAIVEKSRINWFDLQKEDKMSQLTSLMTTLPKTVTFGYEQLNNNKEFRSILMERNVDLIIVDAILSEATFPFIEHLAVPFIFHSSSIGIPWTTIALEAMGADLNYASVPFPMTGFDDQMTFMERLTNIWMAEQFRSMRQTYAFDVLDAHVKKDFPNARPTAEIMKEASLVLVNSHPITDWPRSIPPTVIQIGAPHTRPAKPLPTALQKFADDADDGLIIFTLGSLIKASAMPNETLKVFYKVFSQIPQRVIWKWEGNIPEDISPNVLMVTDWLPQQDLLGHPNTKLFITHGGMLGYQEAIYHAVPILGLPFCNDQRSNVAMAIKLGIGLKLDSDRLDEKELHDKIVRLISESSFKETALRLSRLVRDQLVPGKALAIYWIEYVLRHGSTAHLQITSKNMPMYKQYLIDIMVFLAVLLLVAISSSYYVTYFLIYKLFRCNPDANPTIFKAKINE